MAAASSFGASPDLKDTFVIRQVRRCNRNLLLVNIGILATIALVFGSQWKYFTPTFKASGVVLWERSKLQIPILCLGTRADQLLHLIALRAPWAFFGYSKELANNAKRKWPEMVAAVDQRRPQAGAMKAGG